MLQGASWKSQDSKAHCWHRRTGAKAGNQPVPCPSNHSAQGGPLTKANEYRTLRRGAGKDPGVNNCRGWVGSPDPLYRRWGQQDQTSDAGLDPIEGSRTLKPISKWSPKILGTGQKMWAVGSWLRHSEGRGGLGVPLRMWEDLETSQVPCEVSEIPAVF